MTAEDVARARLEELHRRLPAIVETLTPTVDAVRPGTRVEIDTTPLLRTKGTP